MSETRLGILISGGGTTMAEVIKACQSGEIDMNASCVISSKPDAGGILKAQGLGFVLEQNLFVVQRGDYKENGRVVEERFGEALLDRLKKCGVDFVSQNGWLPYTPDNVISEYEGRIINQHPGPLDPSHKDTEGRRLDFGGVGMYGARVSAALIAYNWMVDEKVLLEASVHHVITEPDGGPLIQKRLFWHVDFERYLTLEEIEADTKLLVRVTKDVQAELLPLEHQTVIQALATLADGKSHPIKRSSPLILGSNADTLYQARDLARRLFPHG